MIIMWAALLAYYNNTLKFPRWYKPYPINAKECHDPSVVQKKFNPELVKVSIHTISTPHGELKAWHNKALKNRQNKGALLVHGGGGNHNMLNPYAHLLSQYGWDSLSIDLPNHGCSYNNQKGLSHGTVESKDFEKFYILGNSLFDLKAIIATSMGVLVSAPHAFNNNWPVKLLFENPMISFQKIVTDQRSYYIPPMAKPFFEWQILKLNTHLMSKPLTDYKPNKGQKILLLYGSQDSLTPVEQASELLKSWEENTSLTVIEGAWHAQLIQHAPGLLQKIVEDFILN
ncbi:MAG: hypothetical protein IPM57_07325 [Oligoflexia bacterium]|nr:hypothetical protein [Oligoflexia bacterium]